METTLCLRTAHEVLHMIRTTDPWHGRQDPSARLVPIRLNRTRIRYPGQEAPGKDQIAEALRWVDTRLDDLPYLRALPSEEPSVSSPLCLLVADESRQRNTDERMLFRTRGPLPHWSLVRLGPGLLASSPEHLLLHMARYLSDLELIWFACTLCAVYSIHPSLRNAGRLLPARPLTTVGQILSYLEHALDQGARWSRKALAAVRHAIDGAASPKEIECALLMTLPRSMGGYALPKPVLNTGIDVDHRLAPTWRWDSLSTDALWAEQRLALEYDSDSLHMDPRQRAKDNAKRNALEAMGYRVLPLSTRQLDSTVLTDDVMKNVARHLGVRRRYKDAGYDWQGRRSGLRRELRRLSHEGVTWTCRTPRRRTRAASAGRRLAGSARRQAKEPGSQPADLL